MLFTIALLFSLAPCKVKASLFESFGFAYEQTLNQSKVTSSCGNSTFIAQQVVESKSIATKVPNNIAFKNYVLVVRKAIQLQVFVNVVALQFPPKYILYKQFKFDVV